MSEYACPLCKLPTGEGNYHQHSDGTRWHMNCAQTRSDIRQKKPKPAQEHINDMYAEMRKAIVLRDQYTRDAAQILGEYRHQAVEEAKVAVRKDLRSMSFWSRFFVLFCPFCK